MHILIGCSSELLPSLLIWCMKQMEFFEGYDWCSGGRRSPIKFTCPIKRLLTHGFNTRLSIQPREWASGNGELFPDDMIGCRWLTETMTGRGTLDWRSLIGWTHTDCDGKHTCFDNWCWWYNFFSILMMGKSEPTKRCTCKHQHILYFLLMILPQMG